MKKMVIFSFLFLMFSLPSFGVSLVQKGIFKDRGTLPNGQIWVSCHIPSTQTCFIYNTDDGTVNTPKAHIWIPSENVGWTDIENPYTTNHNDPITGDYDKLNFEEGENTVEHTSYESWEQAQNQ